ncbi:MAG: hypothetical protein B6D64_05965 [Bacteroidetes bacterium 4484_276]|nr:MAG: hypothetical protein B6D64_05965 [Bacteroidetes bacterium 4484_276]OYT13439.1 MAG: hypothetical protein B6I19_05175 [Bacteroidetes bacterium 4572_114]
MRKFTIILLSLSLFAGLSVSGQNIPNGDFETWTTNASGGVVPEHWTAVHNTSDHQDVFKAGPGYESEYAAELKVVSIGGSIEAAILNYDNIEVNERFLYLTGYFKGSPVENDSLFVFLHMWKDDNTIGEGSIIISEEQAGFTKFTIPIHYTSEEIPTSAQIEIMSGNKFPDAHEGTTYTIDNLNLTDVAGINGPQASLSFLGAAYPSPASQQINIPFELRQPENVSVNIFNIQGQMVYSMKDKRYMQGANEVNISIGNFSPGVYHYTIGLTDKMAGTGTFVVK